MQQSGEYRIGAPREAVWRALNDPDILAQCIEGCQSMEKVGEDAFKAAVKAKVGPVSALFNAEVKLADLDPPNGYTLQANVKGGPAGFGKGTAKVALTDDGPATLLRYEVEGSVGGKLAQVGQRLIDGAARKMADDFFGKFGEVVAPGAAEMLAAPEAAAPEKRGAGRELVIVIIAAIAVAVLTVYLLTS
jgi:uncharacterized protein